MRPAASPGPCPPDAPPAGRNEAGTALVVFADDSSLRRLRPLRRGFRHCFIIVRSDAGWIICDPLSHRTDLAVVTGPTADELMQWYHRCGLRVVPTRLRAVPPRPAPVRPYTCVEAVKRVLGLHAPWVLTPWQLYCRLLQPGP